MPRQGRVLAARAVLGGELRFRFRFLGCELEGLRLGIVVWSCSVFSLGVSDMSVVFCSFRDFGIESFLAQRTWCIGFTGVKVPFRE